MVRDSPDTPTTDCAHCQTDSPFCKHGLSDTDRALQALHYLEAIASAQGRAVEDLTLFRTVDDEKELRVFGLGAGIFDNPNLQHYEYSGMEAVAALAGGASGFGLYLGKKSCGTDGVGVIDNDDADNWPYEDTPTDFAILSGSGSGYHHPFLHDGTVANANTKKDTLYEGSVRTENYYHLIPGSIHPSGGVYSIETASEVPDVTIDDFPEDLHPRSRNVTGPDGEKVEIPRDPPDDLANAEYENEIGWSLQEVRDRSDQLDSLLRHLAPPGYGGDRSASDAATANYLWFWGFDRKDIAHIIRKYRNYEKTQRDDYLYDHTIPFATGGERILEHYDEDGNYIVEPTAMLPLERLDQLSHEDRVRYARKRGITWPDAEEASQRLKVAIDGAMTGEQKTVIASPTGSGKTHNIATTPWLGRVEETGDQPVIHTHETREARDQAAEMSREAGLDVRVLRGRKELCPVCAGHYDPESDVEDEHILIDGVPVSEHIDHLCDTQGLPFSHVHQWVEEYVEGVMPCKRGDVECPAVGQYEGLPRTEGGDPAQDIIHATHQFLHVPSLRMATNVVFDERPSFSADMEPHVARRAVNKYLEYVDAPVDSYAELIYASRNGRDPNVDDTRLVGGVLQRSHHRTFNETMDRVLSEEDGTATCSECGGSGDIHENGPQNYGLTGFDNGEAEEESNDCPECFGSGQVRETRGEPPITWYKQNPQAHVLGPAITRAIWSAEESAAGTFHGKLRYQPPRWGNDQHQDDGWNYVYVDLVLDQRADVVSLSQIPDLSLTRSVVGLDAHPQPGVPYWLVDVHPDMDTTRIMDTEERTLYRRYERGLFTVQVGDSTQPVTTGEYLDSGQGQKWSVLTEQLADHHGEDFDAAITSAAAEEHICDAMRGAGIDSPETMHYGEEKSRNDFAGKRVGAVFGSIDPGDDHIVTYLSRLDADAEPAYKGCPVCEGSGHVESESGDEEMCETCGSDGEVREHGRTFAGEDADLAETILQGIRETHVAQAAGRWARRVRDEDDYATVYVMTDAAPVGFIDAQTEGVLWTTNEEQKERLRYVRDQPSGVSIRAIADEFGCSKSAARRTLTKGEQLGLIERTPGAGPYGADLYFPGETFSAAGAADIDGGAGPTASDGVQGTNTYTVAIDALPYCAYNIPGGEKAGWAFQTSIAMFAGLSDPPS
jgi:hypothetical protein